MATTSVADYIAAQPKTVQAVLRRMRTAIRKALPGAEETISYKIPAYKLHGKTVIHFAGWANHVALYPTGSAAVVAAFKKELSAHEVSKGTIRFSLEEPLPIKLIERIARFRAKEITAKGKTNHKKRA
ncbi:MAG: DUF1801 domain-containing protein [Vulcanimicrobiaceae bacterium]|jgi:uncharacterized protein YdhG (YjbR/CyaY superfamily)